MDVIRQGDILRLEGSKFEILVLSKEFFNQSGMVVACPITAKASADALHIRVITDNYDGIAMLEQLKSLDILSRRYQKIETVGFPQIQNISDAVQSIFDYYPFSQL